MVFIDNAVDVKKHAMIVGESLLVFLLFEMEIALLLIIFGNLKFFLRHYSIINEKNYYMIRERDYKKI